MTRDEKQTPEAELRRRFKGVSRRSLLFMIDDLERAALSTPAPHDCEAWRREGMGCARCNRAPVAAPPADLVALVRDAQEKSLAHNQIVWGDTAQRAARQARDAAIDAVLDFPLPEVPK
jgi:hypothetical protein